MGGNHGGGLGLNLLDQILPSLCQHTRFHGLFGVIFRPILTILRTYCRTVEPVCFTQVKYDWETKEGARTEQLNPIKPLIGQHTRSHGSQQVIFRPIQLFLRTYCDLADPDRFAEVKYGWESLLGTRTEQLDHILSHITSHPRSLVYTKGPQ